MPVTCPVDIEQVCVVLSARCNQSCSYCYQNARPDARMSRATLRACVDLLLSSPRDRVEIAFLGGEPLLEFDLLRDGVEYAKARRAPGKRLRVSIATNGSLFTDEVAEFLAREDVETHLSFDGARPAQDARQPGTFDGLDRLLDRLRERRPVFFRRNLVVAMTLAPRTVPALAESFNYFLGKDVRRIALSAVITRCPEWRLDDIEELDGQFSDVVANARRHFERTGRAPLALAGGPPRPTSPDTGKMMCGILPADAPAVDVDGTVFGCLLFAASYQTPPTELLRRGVDAARVGKLGDRDFAERLAGLPVRIAGLPMFTHGERKRSGYGLCSECPFLEACTVCPAAIAQEGGDPDRVPDFACAYNIVSLRHRAGLPSVRDVRERVRGEPFDDARARWRSAATSGTIHERESLRRTATKD